MSCIEIFGICLAAVVLTIMYVFFGYLLGWRDAERNMRENAKESEDKE